MSTLKGRNGHKGRTFGGVAACPHCSSPIRVYVVAARTQCLLDVVVDSYSLPTQLLAGSVVEQPTPGSVAARVAVQGDTVGDGDDVPITGAIASAQAELFPDVGGFEDDEAPSPGV